MPHQLAHDAPGTLPEAAKASHSDDTEDFFPNYAVSHCQSTGPEKAASTKGAPEAWPIYPRCSMGVAYGQRLSFIRAQTLVMPMGSQADSGYAVAATSTVAPSVEAAFEIHAGWSGPLV